MLAYVSVASSKPKVELDSYVDMCVVGDNCLVIYGHKRPVNIYIYDPRDGHRRAKTVDAAVEYQDPQSEEKFNLMLNQAIGIDDLENHILYPMQCHLNGVHISEVPKFLAESPSVTTCAIESTDPFNAAHLLIILLQLSDVTSYFDVYSLSVAKYEDKDISKIHLTAEKPPCNPSTNK